MVHKLPFGVARIKKLFARNNKGSQPGTSVVVELEKHANKRRLIRKIGMLGAVVFVLGSSGLAAYWVVVSRNDDSKRSNMNEHEKKAKAAFELKDAAAESEALDRLNTASSPEEKSAAYMALSNAASARGDKKAASKYANKALEALPTVNSLVASAFQAEKNKDYKTAAENYGKAAEMIKAAGAENWESEYQNYKSMQSAAEEQL